MKCYSRFYGAFQLIFFLAQISFIVLDGFAIHSATYSRACEGCKNNITPVYATPYLVHAVAIAIHFGHWWKHEKGDGSVSTFTEIVHLFAAATFTMTGIGYAFGNLTNYALWLGLAAQGVWIFRSWFEGYIIMDASSSERCAGKTSFYIAYLVQIISYQILLVTNLGWIAFYYIYQAFPANVYMGIAIASIIGDIILALSSLLYLRAHFAESENYVSIQEGSVFNSAGITRRGYNSGYPNWN